MSTVVIVIHLMIVVALIGVVLLQRSEGGALGIGGGGNFMSGRGAANVLSRTTTYLAIGFFATSITLTILANSARNSGSILDEIPVDDTTLEGTGEGILDQLTPSEPSIPEPPAEQEPPSIPTPE